jgi:hypothetical protein
MATDQRFAGQSEGTADRVLPSYDVNGNPLRQTASGLAQFSGENQTFQVDSLDRLKGKGDILLFRFASCVICVHRVVICGPSLCVCCILASSSASLGVLSGSIVFTAAGNAELA